MKYLIVAVVSIGAMCLAPAHVMSPISYGSRNEASYEAMVAFCNEVPIAANGHPISQALKTLCGFN
jgi:hypothetical protein